MSRRSSRESSQVNCDLVDLIGALLMTRKSKQAYRGIGHLRDPWQSVFYTLQRSKRIYQAVKEIRVGDGLEKKQ